MSKAKKVATFTNDDTQPTSTHPNPQSGADKVQSHSQSYEISELKHLVEQGDRDAMTILGNAYIQGIDIEKDHHAGMQLLKRAADLNAPSAMTLLGAYLWLDIGAMDDPNEFLQLFARADKMGHKFGTLLLVLAHKYGYGTDINFYEDQSLITLARGLSNVNACIVEIVNRIVCNKFPDKISSEDTLSDYERLTSLH